MEMFFSDLGLWPNIMVPFGLVLLGTCFQVASGVGLGLVAAPGLLFLFEGAVAVQVAILLNLGLTILLFPAERKLVEVTYVKRLSIWAMLGIPVGLMVVLVLSTGWLKVFSGVVVGLAAVQLVFSNSKFTQSAAQKIGMPGGGFGSGVMTGALGMPGPIALWAMLNTKLSATVIRANMRAYFLVAYSAALILHLWFNGWNPDVGVITIALTPALLLGAIAGVYAKRAITGETLRGLLEKLLMIMGAVLLFKGISDVV